MIIGSGQNRNRQFPSSSRKPRGSPDRTAWRAEPLEAVGRGSWLLKARLAPGVYRFSLVGGDGRWIIPRGVATVPDDFGGTVGLLVVPS